MNFDPDHLIGMHQKVMGGGLHYLIDFGLWEDLKLFRSALSEIRATESEAIVSEFIDYLQPHFDDGGMPALYALTDTYPQEISDLTDRYYATDEDIYDLVERFVLSELGE